jgi:hypothetical protein
MTSGPAIGRSADTDVDQEETMGKISANFFVSLDGVVESPDQWHWPQQSDDDPLRLVDHEAWPTGVLNLVYAPA